MVVTLSMLQSGIVTISRSFEDGSVSTFHATANPEILRDKRLGSGIYNIDTRKPLTMEQLQGKEFNIVDDDDLNNMNELDKYLNRGVNGECFES